MCVGVCVQINKAAHASYNKGKDEYKKQYRSKCLARVRVSAFSQSARAHASLAHAAHDTLHVLGRPELCTRCTLAGTGASLPLA